MARRKLLAGNWKMNKSIGEVAPFFRALREELETTDRKMTQLRTDIMFAVPYLHLSSTLGAAATLGIQTAAQNVHWEKSGAFTGEISAAMLKEIGISNTLIGHSERRQYFGETDETVAKKVAAAIAAGLTVVACIGETLGEREKNQTNDVLRRQVPPILKAAAAKPEALILAYEPVWAIGTGLSATDGQAQQAHHFIRTLIAEVLGAQASEQMRILYGGSANPANISQLLAQPDIDGGLIGGASIKAADFAAMVKAAEASAR